MTASRVSLLNHRTMTVTRAYRWHGSRSWRCLRSWPEPARRGPPAPGSCWRLPWPSISALRRSLATCWRAIARRHIFASTVVVRHHLAGAMLHQPVLEPGDEHVGGHRVQLDPTLLIDKKPDLVRRGAVPDQGCADAVTIRVTADRVLLVLSSLSAQPCSRVRPMSVTFGVTAIAVALGVAGEGAQDRSEAWSSSEANLIGNSATPSQDWTSSITNSANFRLSWPSRPRAAGRRPCSRPGPST